MQELKGFQEGLPVITKLIANLLDQMSTPVILIDGRAGSGKSHFAAQLKQELFALSHPVPKVIAMDELYPGWEGLQSGANYLVDNILTPLSKNQPALWQQWDWSKNQRGGDDVGNGQRSFEGDNALIVEGCGSLSLRSKPFANLSIWIERPQIERKQAIKQRDGNKFDPYWDIWFSQEEEFYLANSSSSLADLLLNN